jgi:23S rRNA (uridine2552-2'-O)-methyltransferase
MARPGQKDPYGVRAKEAGYPARSVYKLKEIQDKYRLIRPGQRIVDLGCHPGSWLRYCSQLVGPDGLVLGVDVKEPTIPLSFNMKFLQADLLTVSDETIKAWAGQVDVVVSDLSPKTSGIKWQDHQRSMELNSRALELGFLLLIRGGVVVLKIFEGEGSQNLIKIMKNRFEQVRNYKPKSSRSESPEVYLIGQGFRG